jgi:hypothetical protein
VIPPNQADYRQMMIAQSAPRVSFSFIGKGGASSIVESYHPDSRRDGVDGTPLLALGGLLCLGYDLKLSEFPTPFTAKGSSLVDQAVRLDSVSLPAACFFRMISAADSLARCISEPLMLLDFFYCVDQAC